MAKNSKKTRYVKLGEKASSFSDPSSKLKVTPNVAVKLELAHKQSRRVVNAIKAGHLDYCEADEFDSISDETLTNTNTNKEGSSEPHTSSSLKKLNKKALMELATTMGTEETVLDLEEMTKAEVAEEILDLQDLQEEEE